MDHYQNVMGTVDALLPTVISNLQKSTIVKVLLKQENLNSSYILFKKKKSWKHICDKTSLTYFSQISKTRTAVKRIELSPLCYHHLKQK